MSNLLEQAIVDANALRETALKSAKDALIEKYKDEFRESVEKIFEQQDAAEVGMDTAGISPEQTIDPTNDAMTEPTEAGGEAFKDVESSFLDGDDDELITIDFDQIEKQISNILSSPVLASPQNVAGLEQPVEEPSDEEQPAEPDMQALSEELEIDEELNEEEGDVESDSSDDSSDSDIVDEDLELEEDIEEGYDHNNTEGLNIDALTEVEDDSRQIQAKKIDITKRMANLKKQLADLQGQLSNLDAANAEIKSNAEQSSTDQYELTEEELQELAEELKVDIEVEGLLDGHMGTHQGEKREVRNMELAAARDECAEDDREEELDRLGDLKKELNESRSQNKKYSNLIEELKDNLIVLKEQTEKLSISNAKLLYINKVFANISLNERQKQAVVESISKASSVLEAKTIFGTLQSTVEGLSNKKSKESLSEALNRGNTVFSVRPKMIQEDVNLSERFKILAGIK